MGELLAFEYVKTNVDKKDKFWQNKSIQHVLVALQYEKSSSDSIFIFVISLFGCPPALDARGRRPFPPLHATVHGAQARTIRTKHIDKKQTQNVL